MKYRVFQTEAEAIADEAQVAAAIGCSKVGVNAKTGLPALQAQVTERWAIPQQIPSLDDTGVEPEPDWWPAVPIWLSC